MRLPHSFPFLLLLALTLTLLGGCSSKKVIVTDLQERDANELIVFLAGNDVEADKTEQSTTGAAGGEQALWTISVPTTQAIEALAILNRNGLPRRPVNNLLGLFPKSGLVSSAQEEQIRFQEGLSRQIAGVIQKIDGVLDADVQISFPQTEETGGVQGGQPAGAVRASVFVKHQGILDDPNIQLVPKIKRLVAGSVVGLSYDNVTVVTDTARFAAVPIELGGAAPLPEQERQFERVWSVIVAKDSVGRFRTIFFALCIVILLLAALLAWMIWKLFPTLQRTGGMTQLFTSLKPLDLPVAEAPTAPSSSGRGLEEEELGFEAEDEDEF